MVDRDRFMNFVGWVNPDLGRFLSNDNDSAPTANATDNDSAPTANATTSRFLKISQAIFIGGFVTSIIAGHNYVEKKCESKFPEIELPKNATQDLIDEFDYRNDLRHNCKEELKDMIFYAAILYTASLSIVNVLRRTSCLSTIGSMLPYFRGSNREGVELQDTPLPGPIPLDILVPITPNIQIGELPAVTISNSPQVARHQTRSDLNTNAGVINPQIDSIRGDNSRNGDGGGARASFNPSNPTAIPAQLSPSHEVSVEI